MTNAVICICIKNVFIDFISKVAGNQVEKEYEQLFYFSTSPLLATINGPAFSWIYTLNDETLAYAFLSVISYKT